MDADVLIQALRSDFEDVGVILKRLNLEQSTWNEVASDLHALYKLGKLLRKQDGTGQWMFAVEGEDKPAPVQDEFPAWAKIPEWGPADGPIRNVFSGKPAGHRCLWSCRWAGWKERPEDLGYSLEEMSNAEIHFELRDVGARGDADAASLALDYPAEEGPTGKLREKAVAILRQARAGYLEYTAPWALGPRVRSLRWRAGWEVILPWPERLAPGRGRTGWVYLKADGSHVELSTAERIREISMAEKRIARRAVLDAQSKGWGL